MKFRRIMLMVRTGIDYSPRSKLQMLNTPRVKASYAVIALHLVYENTGISKQTILGLGNFVFQ